MENAVAQGVAHGGLTEIAIVALAAMACGIAMERLRQPALVGYILAGVLLGPSALGLVTDREQIDALAELGVLLLLYVVGMELSLRAFRKLWRLALLTTAIQIAVSCGLMLLFWGFLGWPIGIAILLGFVLAVSSTAVVIKILNDLGETKTRVGRITVGVLIAQDLAVVPMMLTVSALAGGGFDWAAIPKVAGSIAVLGVLVLALSRGRRLRLPFGAMVAGHDDLKPLAALALCFAGAAVSGLMGLSAAYGAFIAGLVIGSSTERNAMVEATRPVQSILMMIFFLSIGLLIDLDFIWNNLWTVLVLFTFVVVFKTALNMGALRLLGQPWPTAFMAGVLLSQIGEFSFLLSQLGVEAGVISRDDSRIVIAVTVLSLAVSPLWVVTGRRLHQAAAGRRATLPDVLRSAYGPEAELVAGTFDEARSSTRRTWRGLLARWRRRQRAARKRDAAAATAEKPPEEGAQPEAEPPVIAGAEGIPVVEPSPAPKKAPQGSEPEPEPKLPRRKRRARSAKSGSGKDAKGAKGGKADERTEGPDDA